MDEEIWLPIEDQVEVPTHFAEDKWWDADTAPVIVDVTQRAVRPAYTLSFNGVGFAPLGGVQALTGQSGNGKTMTFSLLMSALLGGRTGGDLKKALPEDVAVKVLYIDTEMEVGNTMMVINRVYSMMGWQFGVPHEEFEAIHLREVTDAADRWRLTLKRIDEIRPTVVFIDGLLDLVRDFNSNEECQMMIYKVMKLASLYGMSVWCLVHENPGATKMVGHLGSMLSRKVTDVFTTTKNRDAVMTTFTVKQTKARGKDVPDMQFTVDDGVSGLGEPSLMGGAGDLPFAPVKENSMPVTRDEWVVLMTEMVPHFGGISTYALREGLKTRLSIGSAKADKVIANLETDDVLRRDSNKRYYLSDGSNQTNAFEDEDDKPF